MILLTPEKSLGAMNQTGYWDGIFTVDQLQYILALPCWVQQTAGLVGGSGSAGEENKTIRSSRISWMTFDEKTSPIFYHLGKVIATANAKIFNYDLTGFDAIQCGIYSAGDQDHYDWHCDSGPTVDGAQRKLSISILLDDPSTFEGGMLQVKLMNDAPITLDQQLGRALMFPSYTLHRVTPVTKGIRRSLVIWVVGPDFR